MASRISLLLFVTMLSLVSAAPYLFRVRRATLEPSEITSNDPTTADNSKTNSRRGKVLNFLEVPAEKQDDESTNTFENERGSRSTTRQRQNKALNYFDYVPQFFASDDDYADDELTLESNDNVDDEDLSRTIPSRRKQNPYKDFSNTNSLGFENSPIYYIRLPPTPYMFVPGLGYVSNPPSIGPPVPPPVNPFINLPIDFVSNGKPTNVYQWTGGPSYQTQPAINTYNPFSRPSVSRPQQSRPNDYNFQRPKPSKKPITDSKITTLNKGPYLFNGKPSDIFVLRDSYNSLYSDALQNFYP